MSSDTEYDIATTDSGIELFIHQETGEVFASQRMLARMVGVGESSVRYWKTAQKINTRTAKVITSQGLRAAQLLSENDIYEAFAKWKPELLVKCAKAGLRLYLHGLAGYRYEAKKNNSTQVYPHLQLRQFKEDLDAFWIDVSNPRMAQAYQDYIQNNIFSFNALPSLQEERWAGVVEIAEELGYRQAVQPSTRVKLGRHVALEPDLDRRKEKRLCNGTRREIWLYRVTENLKQAIVSFFGSQ